MKVRLWPCLLALVPCLFPLRGEEPKEEKPTRPEHNVTLQEEDDVLRLLKKAQKAREQAEQDATAWPEAVKAYAQILEKYSDRVYLHRWEGDGQEKARGYGQGVYRATSERVAEELANLPAAGLRIYRAVNDGTARALMAEAMERQVEAPMEKVAQIYFSTSWGDDALAWLGELAYDRGSDRQAIGRLARIEKHPDSSIPKVGVLARLLLAQVKARQRSEAEQTLASLEAALKDPKNGELRVGHEHGEAALAALKTRLQAAPAVPKAVQSDGGWETYFGNAAHYKPHPNKSSAGVRKWTIPIIRLLGAPEGAKPEAAAEVQLPDGQVVKTAMANMHLVARGGWFFITDGEFIACHSVGNPNPDRPKFTYPYGAKPTSRGSSKQTERMVHWGRGVGGVAWQPQFVTLGEDHLYAVVGPDPVVMQPQFMGQAQFKQPSNCLVALGKMAGGNMGVESGKLRWSLDPQGDMVNAKADKEWLAEIRFVSAPSYVEGSLYVTAVNDSGAQREAWVCAFDATNGRMLWRTMICSAQPLWFNGSQQPALGLPVAVHGGTVYCVTNLGAVAALESATGAIKWIRIYERIASAGNMHMRGMVTSRDLWAPNPPIVFENLLLCTPQDSDTLYAFDMQSGYRVWERARVSDPGFGVPAEAERLKYVLGIVHDKWLVLSGKNVNFVDLRGGKLDTKGLIGDDEAAGRGLVAGDAIWIPTAKNLIRIDAGIVKSADGEEKPGGRIKEAIGWQDPESDPGNLFLANDVLFSVSHSHVSAWFVWQDLEKKLQARIAAAPDDLMAYIELGDGYHIMKLFDEAIATFSKGIEAAGKSGGANAQEQGSEMKSRRFEAWFAAGMRNLEPDDTETKPDAAQAYSRFESGLQVAHTPDQFVRALWKMAESAEKQGEAARAVMIYHRMMTEHGETVYAFQPTNISKASIYAQREIARIKDKDAQAAAELEKLAAADLAKAKAAGEVAALEAFVARYPNAEVYGDALLALADIHLQKGDGDLARQFYQRYLYAHRKSPKAAEVLAKLVLAYEKSENLAPAKSTLFKLARDASLAAAQLVLPGEAAQQAGAWAEKRLAEARYTQPISMATARLRSGRLAETWSHPAGGRALPLVAGGRPSAQVQKLALFADPNGQLSARSGSTGAEAWKEQPKAPAGFNAAGASAAWSDDLLVVAGTEEIAAFDSKLGGKEAWRHKVSGDIGTGGGPILNVQAADQRVLIVQQGGMLTVLGAATGEILWRTQAEGGPINGLPYLGENYVAVATGGARQKLALFELQTGVRRMDLTVPENRVAAGPVGNGESLYVVDAKNRLVAYSAANGKALWEFDIGGAPLHLAATHDGVYAVLGNLETVVCDPHATAEDRRLKWKARPDGGGEFAGLVADGDDVFLAVRRSNRNGNVYAYHARSGKLQWKSDLAGADTLSWDDVAQEHLLLMQSPFDPQGHTANMVALISRRTGKLTWTHDVDSARNSAVALFDGGVAIADGQKVTGFLCADPERAQAEAQAILEAVQKNPKDVSLKLQLAQFQFDSNQREKAMETILGVLADETLSDEAFGLAYDRFAGYRQRMAKEAKPTLRFARLAKAPALDGTMKGWEGVPATELKGWRTLYLVGESDARTPVRRAAWRGAGDLEAAFRGAYDAQALYLCVVVGDDTHANIQTKAIDLWNGDSVQFAFDMERDTRRGYFGDDTEVGLALSAGGAQLAFRWVERGKYLMKPLEAQAKVVRDEAAKKTVYQLALPYDLLGLKGEPGTQFGFAFMVNDLDEGENVQKGAAPSPGIWDPKDPSRYAIGELAKPE